MPKSVKRGSTCSGRRAFFDQELRFAHVGQHHAIAHEAAAVSHHHADLAELLGQSPARGDHFFTGRLAAHDLHQPHDVRGAEEVKADHHLRARRGEAISSMSSVEVFDASTQSGLAIASISAKICFLRAMFSNTASMMRSASSKPS